MKLTLIGTQNVWVYDAAKMLSEHMLGSRSCGMGLIIVLLFGAVVSGGEVEWAYERRKDYLTNRESDYLEIRGRYVYSTPLPHDDGLPTFGVSCSDGKLDAIVISTGVAIDSQFGASPRVRTRIDGEKPKSDRVAPVLMADSKTLRFNGSRNRIGGTDMLFAKKYLVTVEAYGARVVEMEFEIPSDSSSIQKYCGVEPRQVHK
jgi:hypothetical protein